MKKKFKNNFTRLKSEDGEVIEVGNTVYIKSLRKRGKVEAVAADSTLLINIDNTLHEFDFDAVKRVETPVVPIRENVKVHTYNRERYRPETVYNELYEITPRGKIEKPIEKNDTLQKLEKMTEFIPYTGRIEIPAKDRERLIKKDGTVNKTILFKELLLGKLSVTQWQRFDSMRDHYEVIPKHEQRSTVVSTDSDWWYYNRYKIISHSRHSYMSNDTIHMGDYQFNYVSPLPQYIPEYGENVHQEKKELPNIIPDYIPEPEPEQEIELLPEPKIKVPEVRTNIDKKDTVELTREQRLQKRIEELRPYSDEIPQEIAQRAFSNTSFSSKERGLSARIDYAETVLYVMSKAEETKQIRTDLAEEIDRAFQWFRMKYKEATLSYLHSHSNIASTMIVGGSNFPVARMEKLNRWAHNKLERILEVRDSTLKRFEKLVEPEEDKPIREGDENALQRAEEKLRKLEHKQTLMVEANKLIRKSYSLKDTREIMEEKLRALGLDDTDMKTILYKGKISGFQDYELRNNNAEMKRMKDRVERLRQLDSAKNSDLNLSKWTFNGGYVQVNYDVARYQVFFDSKPNYDQIQKLKKAGFRWTPSIGAWQSYLKLEYLRRLTAIVGDLIKVKGDSSPISEAKESETKKNERYESSQSDSNKEPWQLTEREWGNLYNNSHPGNGTQSRVTRNSGSELLSQMKTYVWLQYGVRDDLKLRYKRATLPKDDPNYLYMSPEEAEEIVDELNDPITHFDVIKKALNEGKPVPQHIVDEYRVKIKERESLQGTENCRVIIPDSYGEYEVEYDDGKEIRDIIMSKDEVCEQCNVCSMNDQKEIMPVNNRVFDTYKPSEIKEIKKEELRLNNLDSFLIKLCHPFRMLVWGLPGRGKSTLMLALAEDLQFNKGKVLFVMTEEKIPDGRLTGRLENANVSLFDHKVEFVDNYVLYNIRDHLRHNPDVRYVMIDSVNTLNAVENRTVKEDELIKLYNDFPAVSFVFILQANKDGKTYKGFAKLAHMVDTVIPIIDKVATLSKHRDEKPDQEMPVFSLTAVAARRHRKYSGAAFQHLERAK